EKYPRQPRVKACAGPDALHHHETAYAPIPSRGGADATAQAALRDQVWRDLLENGAKIVPEVFLEVAAGERQQGFHLAGLLALGTLEGTGTRIFFLLQGAAQLLQRDILQLTDPLPGHAKFLAHFLKRLGLLAVEAETGIDDLPLAFVEHIQQAVQ